MDRSDFAPVAQRLTAMSEVYGRHLGEAGLGVWWLAMRPYDAADVIRALERHAVDPEAGQYMPKPADVVRCVDGAPGDSALLAWGAVAGAMRTVGAYRSVRFDDPAIHAAITDMGGWGKLCGAEASAQAFDQKRFCDAYRVYAKRDDLHAPAVLDGLCAPQNALKGHQVEPPVLIASPSARRPPQHLMRIEGAKA